MSMYIRLKYADKKGYVKCVTCGVVRHWKDQMDCGHYIPRTHNATFLCEENLHPQCKSCNVFAKGRMDEYALFIIDTYGIEKLRELRALKYTSKKFTVGELEDLIAELKEEVDKLLLEKR